MKTIRSTEALFERVSELTGLTVNELAETAAGCRAHYDRTGECILGPERVEDPKEALARLKAMMKQINARRRVAA